MRSTLQLLLLGTSGLLKTCAVVNGQPSSQTTPELEGSVEIYMEDASHKGVPYMSNGTCGKVSPCARTRKINLLMSATVSVRKPNPKDNVHSLRIGRGLTCQYELEQLLMLGGVEELFQHTFNLIIGKRRGIQPVEDGLNRLDGLSAG